MYDVHELPGQPRPINSTHPLSSLHPPNSPQLLSDPRITRLQSEWDLLLKLVERNPARLTAPRRRDTEIFVTLLATPAQPLGNSQTHPQSEHRLRVVFPRFYPAMPLEAYLEVPMLHPNIHPENGFICLWDRHRPTNTIEHALHKTVAILGWRLLNREAMHIMQPEAIPPLAAELTKLETRLSSEPLQGIEHQPLAAPPERQNTPRRHRLS